MEFPEYGETKKHLLPVFYDADEEALRAMKDTEKGVSKEKYWMPVMSVC